VSLNSRQRYGSPVYENSRNGCTETIGTGVRKRSERAEQADPAWKARYRADRPIVERKIAHFTRRPWGGRKARTRGLERVATDSTPEPAPSTGHDWRFLVCITVTTVGRSPESARKNPIKLLSPEITALWPLVRLHGPELRPE